MATVREQASPDLVLSVPSGREILIALGMALAAVMLTRLPVARVAPSDFDEVGFLQTIGVWRMPMHHTLFLATARVVGTVVGNPYRGFVLLDSVVSAGALVAVWWWLRAVAGPRAAIAGTAVLGAAPVFWSYGAMAGNYTAIPLVGSLLLGIAYRGASAPRAWHPFVAAVVLAIGAGYRQDIGTFWLPVFLVVLWQHRWLAATQAALLALAIGLAWFVPMLHEAGGWSAWREASAEFAYKAGYLNSYWNLGWVDAPVRYAVKAALAVGWTLGPGLLFVPRGGWRIAQVQSPRWFAVLLVLSVLPALASHLMVHFGVAGYAFHYMPALVALVTLGIGRGAVAELSQTLRLAGLATCLAAVFLVYPTDYERRGLRGNFDLTIARHSRIGLRTPTPLRDPALWRTANSQTLPGGVEPPKERRRSLAEIWHR
jgi:hypothetical protein